MGNWMTKEPPPPMVLVPPLFDSPPLAARTRMIESAYDLLFGKLPLKCLFEEYFEQANNFNLRILLKPKDDPNVDLIATISGPLGHKTEQNISADALFNWKWNVKDPHTFTDLFVSNSEQILRLRSCTYYTKYGIGVFGIFPLLAMKRETAEDYGLIGLRYGSENLSIGTTFLPFPSSKFPRSAWLVARLNQLSIGVQYKPDKSNPSFEDLTNWSWAIGYGSGSSSPLIPSFSFNLELVKNSQMIASFYQHAVVQRRVKNPFEDDEIVGITNYIDFGFELKTRIKGDEASSNDGSTFLVALSWQANKNFLVKGKLGHSHSSIALAFKSWWKPSFTFSISAAKDRILRETVFGFGIRIEDLREASYERADPNYLLLTPSKEHLAEGLLHDFGKRPMLQSEIDSENFNNLPVELKPLEKII